MRRLGRTPPFRSPDGTVRAGSVAEILKLRLGGVDQWVLIRGASTSNPPLVVLHGGPGFSDTALLRHFNAPVEDSFTVVYWEQRGTGRSFDRHIPRSSMTVERFLADLDELVDEVRARLEKTKVVIFGHSWGTLLGTLYAARFPEKVALYVGAAQLGDWPAAEAASYSWALAIADLLGNRKALQKLRAIGPPPYPASSVFTERTTIQRLEGQLGPGELWKLGRAVLSSPESALSDLPDVLRGFRFTMDAMWPEVSKLNLLELVPALKMPVFVFLGRNDHWVPPQHSLAYVDALSAPFKQVVWFESSGHQLFADEPQRFNAVMANRVRPMCEPQMPPRPARPPAEARQQEAR